MGKQRNSENGRGLATLSLGNGDNELLEDLEELREDLSAWISSIPAGPIPMATRLKMPRLLPGSTPRVDMFEENGNLVVKAEVPGLKAEEIDLSIEDDDLVIRAEHDEDHEIKDEDWHRMERSWGRVYRRLDLPDGVKAESVRAHLANGVLTITMAKPNGTVRAAKKIQVTSA